MESHEDWYDIAVFALNTGLRRGEVFSLSFDNVNFYERIIYVVDTKTKRNRAIPLNETAFNVIDKKK